ncbi:Histone-lysine N-methyltransferase SETMAR [Araneus ventricosus]|uniref:Histone-lysine N-methyltransferase SETMAR n=1 Tax=Araneus ventricosus TaxID=182803 RepID=A0A4Y2BQD5_ARAVE|nr:Histone-lysine N-methyltransferase SETMAR [Araneus ventricosus]
MEEQEAVIRFLFAKGKKAREIHSEMVEVYGKDCIDRINGGRWCKMFQDGRKSLVDEVLSGRPVSSSTRSIVDEIDNVMRENRRTMLNEIKERCNISYGSAWDIVHQKLACRKVCSRWVPKQFSEQHTGCKMACSLKHLQRYIEEGNELLASIVKRDETCALHMTPESKTASLMWKHPSSPSQKKFKVSPSTWKLVLTVFWVMKEVLLAEFLPRGSTVNAVTYCVTLTKLRRAIRDKRSATNQSIRLLHDNARPHVSLPVREKWQVYGLEVLEHPQYSPDLGPSDFHLFGPMKKFLGGKKKAVRRWLFSQPTGFCETGIFKLNHRWDKCLNMHGSYVEK